LEQPVWRLQSDNGELCPGGTGDVSATRRCGQNGLIEYIMTLGWWGTASNSGSAQEQEEWLRAVAEVSWVCTLRATALR
jgi:hypothetical protein